MIFPPEARGAFLALYPEQAGIVAHGLRDHPLLARPALAALAERMDAAAIEHNRADLPIGVPDAHVPSNGLTPAETIRTIADNGSWVVLKFVERDPAYRALLDEVLGEIAPLVAPVTGAMLKREAFIFVSSPRAVTPFHFDPEHNILLQIEGAKTMTVFPAADRAIVPAEQHERFHAGGHRNLPFDEALAPRGRMLAIAPGEAIHVPVKAPHWVANGDAPSVSLSVTWRSEWSYREADAHALNRALRGLGLTPRAPGRYPRQNHAKSLAYRVLRKARGMMGAKSP